MTEQAQQTNTLTSDAVVDDSFQYTHSHTYDTDGKIQILEPIAILLVDDDNPFPESQNLNLVQIIELAEVAVQLLANFAVNLTNLLNVGAVGPTADSDESDNRDSVHEMLDKIEDKIKQLGKLIILGKSFLKQVETNIVDELKEEIKDTVEDVIGFFKRKIEGSSDDSDDTDNSASDPSAILKGILKEILALLVGDILTAAGLKGEATSIRQFADQFQTFTVPDVLSTTNNDIAFAALQVSGPNPLVIERALTTGSDVFTDKFPVTNDNYQKVMGADDSLELAVSQNRLYLTDYQALAVLEPGTLPQQKYIAASMGLFAVSKGDSSGTLKPVAIQVGPQPDATNPVIYPFNNTGDNSAWQLAKVHFQAANGNYHELISHLGLTHLLIEPFAISTHRMLDDDHPIFKLLLPHIQGTLFINNAAVASLINPGGTVDQLLGGTIETDWQVTTNALGALNFEQRMLPNQLNDRHMADPNLPVAYPYRDDALDVWAAIKSWVADYVSIYYADDAAVAADQAIQNWVLDLTSMQGGRIKGLGKRQDGQGQLGIYSKDYLTDVLTMVIFTASAQHAAVNFPQKSVMSYTPAMPLAAYASAPTSTDGSHDASLLTTLPPLEQALVQQALGQGLGGVYFTRLGDYNRHQRGNYFTDPKVQQALDVFRDNLDKVEETIGARNLNRASYQSLLPSQIPQSINI